MAKNEKKMITTTTTANRTYGYRLGNVSLNFTLRNDTKQEMKDFLECIEQAKVDVTEELEKLNNK